MWEWTLKAKMGKTFWCIQVYIPREFSSSFSARVEGIPSLRSSLKYITATTGCVAFNLFVFVVIVIWLLIFNSNSFMWSRLFDSVQQNKKGSNLAEKRLQFSPLKNKNKKFFFSSFIHVHVPCRLHWKYVGSIIGASICMDAYCNQLKLRISLE